MATKHKLTVSVQPTKPRPTSAERRAAEVATLSSKQAKLKQESAERRAKRASADAEAPEKARAKPRPKPDSPR